MTHRQTIQFHLEKVRQIAAKHGAGDVRFFGSVARGDEKTASDMDLIVRSEPQRTLLDHAGLQIELEELLGFKVDVISEAGLKGRFRDRALREAIPI